MSPVSSLGDPDGPVGDPGLASQRTALAWNRSGLAVLVAMAVMVRRLWPLHGETSVVILLVVAAGGLVWAVGMFMTGGAGLDREPSGVLTVSGGRVLTAGTLLLALAGLLLGIFSLP